MEARFLNSKKPHLVIVTNHGMHEWKIDAGLPDTGGQNIYVNQVSDALRKLGFRVTIYNRGGYNHPQGGAVRRGTTYRSAEERLTYLEDSQKEFVRKEDMAAHVQELSTDLVSYLKDAPAPVAIIFSTGML